MKKKQQKESPPKPKKANKTTSAYHHGDLRNLVLKIAGDFLEKRGAHNLSLRDVATEIGVSHTAPYRHFPRKIDLLHAITTIGFLELRDTLLQAWKEHESAVNKLRKAGENYIRLMWKFPRRSELMFGGEVYLESELPEDLQTAGKEAYLALYHIIEFGQKSGEFNTEVDAESMSMTVWSAVHGFAALNERSNKNAKAEEQMQNLLDIVLVGIRKKDS